MNFLKNFFAHIAVRTFLFFVGFALLAIVAFFSGNWEKAFILLGGGCIAVAAYMGKVASKLATPTGG